MTGFTVGAAPRRRPLLGHLLSLRSGPLEFLAGLPAYGDLVEIGWGPRRAIVLCHPELVHQLLRDDSTYDKGGPYFEKIRQVFGMGLFTSGHERHRRQQRFMRPVFRHDRLAGYAELMGRQTMLVTGEWRDGLTVDVIAQTTGIAARVSAQALFSTRLTPETAAVVQRCTTTLLDGLYRRMLLPQAIGNRRFNQAQAGLDRVVHQIIESHRRDGADHADLVSTLLAARDETGDAMTDQEIRDEVITFIFGGTETTASLLAWCFHLLARHPEVEERLHAEVAAVLPTLPATYADLPKLQYTRQVIEEALRLYSPAWVFTRETTTGTRLGGLDIPAKTTLIYSPYMLHRRADLFPDPERFDPDRWLPDAAHPMPRKGYLPFGVGARKCIGESFARTEAAIVLATIAGTWRLRHVPAVTVRPQPRVALRPHPLLMRVRRWSG